MNTEALRGLYDAGRDAGKLDGLLMAMTALADAGLLQSETYRVVEVAMRRYVGPPIEQGPAA